MGRRKIIKNRPESDQESIENYIEKIAAPGSAPVKSTPNRGEDISLRGEEIKSISVGLEDIDQAVLYYFENVVKPYVVNEGTLYNIPVVYADPEKWKSAQKDGQYRDKEGKVQFPIITVKRENMEKRRDLGNKLDGNKVHLYQSYQKRYSQKNQYDNFSVLTNRIPVKEFYNIVVPDYYTITYNCSIFTNYVSDMNKIIEAIGFRADSYWGEPNKFLFKARVDSFPITNEINDGTDRRFISNFMLIMNGFLTPNNIDKYLASAPKFLSKAQVIFTLETTTSNVNDMDFSRYQPKQKALSTFIPEGVNVYNNFNITALDTAIISYLNVSKTVDTQISSAADTAIFLNQTILTPPSESGISFPTTVNFNLFIAGQYADPSAVISVAQSGSNIVAIFNTGSLGYTLAGGKTISLNGKIA